MAALPHASRTSRLPHASRTSPARLLHVSRTSPAGAQMVGLAQGALDLTLPYVHERRQFGSRIADFQAVQHCLAQASS